MTIMTGRLTPLALQHAFEKVREIQGQLQKLSPDGTSSQEDTIPEAEKLMSHE